MRIKTKLSIRENDLVYETSVLFIKKTKIWEKVN
jgi:hypothetical protein